MGVAVSTPSSQWWEVEVSRKPRLHILHRTKGGFCLRTGDQWTEANARRCFPWCPCCSPRL